MTITKEEVNNIFKEKDINGTGTIDYREFVISLADRSKLYEEEKIKGFLFDIPLRQILYSV